MQRSALAACGVVATAMLSACGSPASAATGEAASVTLTAGEGRAWTVRYELRAPARELRLVRTPDATSRTSRWRLPAHFELVHEGGHDRIRRRDGERFASVGLEVPGTYRPLPKEYAPFSPYSDGGVLIHSGRFHACAGPCPLDEGGDEGPWRFTLTPPEGRRAIVAGAVYGATFTWLDRGDGTKVYVGAGEIVESPHVLSVVDRGLPPRLVAALDDLFPRLLAYYERRLEPPPGKAMLFASHDPDYAEGWGRQGGTLPGQVFVHFYGPGWDAEAEAARRYTSLEDVAFFFAHEAAHIFQAQHRVHSSNEHAWIHEGGADAFALLALTELGLADRAFVGELLAEALARCAGYVERRPLPSAAASGAFPVYYACGLLMQLAVDAAARRASDGERDLFAVWRRFLAEVRTDADWSAETFLDVAAVETDAQTAAFLAALARTAQPDARAFLEAGLAAAGVELPENRTGGG